MKVLLQFIPEAMKAVIVVCASLVGIGWGAFMAIDVMTSGKVKASVDQLEVKFMQIRLIDKEHFDKRLDKIEVLIEKKR